MNNTKQTNEVCSLADDSMDAKRISISIINNSIFYKGFITLNIGLFTCCLQCHIHHCLIDVSSSLYPFGMWTKVQFLGCVGELSF